ncbi:MAG: hypothetical protein GX138_08685 [Firmicutes bacterium]|jgi:C_GCAxxG_C_C family probable redox protein|nr:hypothetical protein [Bacillota bacterium]
MSKTGDRAQELFNELGYSCSEAVFIALAEADGLSQEEIDAGNKYAGPFCGGMGSASVCGALSGGIMTFGRYFGRAMGEERNPDMSNYSEALFSRFVDEFGTPDCSALKNEPDYKEQCSNYVRFVVDAVNDLLDNGLYGDDDDDCG